ncbi:MAG: rod shape-determining protein RodA [bacterium]|nr:rod shape-determining protein RodA [bacterium]
MADLKTMRRFNWGVAASAAALILIGLCCIYSATWQPWGGGGVPYVRRQAVWAAAGIAAAALLALFDYRKLAAAAPAIYVTVLLVLAAVLLTADPRRGAQSWFAIGTFAVQPSEFAKIAVVIALAGYLSRGDADRSGARSIAGALLLAGIPAALILRQPDLGTALVIVPVVFAMLFVAGASSLSLLFPIAGGALLLPAGWLLLKPYQQARIRVFLNPQLDPLRSGYNAIQSFIAVGSGGLWGQGWLHGTQTRLRFLPERHTDFIFCVLAEEGGFIGCLLLLALYGALLYGGLRIADASRDEFGRLLATGITALLAAHVVINVGMTMGLLPITGLPLPLMSYGGSSLVSTCISIGLLQSIWSRRYVF